MAESRKSKIFNKYLSRMSTIKKESYAAELFAALSTGKNSYMRIDRLESSNFDMTWIKEIENCIYDLGEIVANPREVTKTVTSIVPVELARKTGAESVQHLASHTQYIKEITPEGDVVPNKILNIGSEEDIHTYENRFIATLIRRLLLFVEKRYEFVKKFAPLHDEEILYYKTKAIVDGSEVEIETKIKVRSESDTEIADMSNKYVDRILKIREYIMYFYGSKFMKELRTERDVRNPIVMTNILRKNPKYHKCYELFKFIEKYDKLGVSYKIDEDASIFTDEELAELNTVAFTNYLALKARDRSKTTKTTTHSYKPRILTSIDDEKFIYGDLLRGPIEFVRVDEGYQKYLDEKLTVKLPPHPTKIEKEYYQEEITEKNERKADKAAIDKLSKRKKKEQLEYEKQVKAIIAQREKEEQERIAREKELARQEEERRIEEVRRSLIEDALSNDVSPVNEEPVEEEPILEQPVVEEEVVEPATEVVEEQPVIEEAPVEEDIQPVEEEIAPVEVVEEAPIEEQPTEEVPVEEQQIEEEVIPQEDVPEEPVEEIQPENEQIEQPVVDIPQENEEQPQEEVAEIEPVVEEEVPEEQPVEEVVEEPVQEEILETPVIEEPVEEQPVIEEPVVEEANETPTEPAPEVVEEVPTEEPVEEPAPVVVEEQPVQPQPTPKKKASKTKKVKAPKVVEQPEEHIPGKFIVKTAEGYYVDENTFSVYKHDAFVFDDFIQANKIKKAFGGKVVKL